MSIMPPFSRKPSTIFLRLTAFSIFSMSSPYFSKCWQIMFSTKLERCCLCRPTCARWSRHAPVFPYSQIGCLSVAQFNGNEKSLLVGFQCFFPHLGTDASLSCRVLCVPCILGGLSLLYLFSFPWFYLILYLTCFGFLFSSGIAVDASICSCDFNVFNFCCSRTRQTWNSLISRSEKL